jgi:hypothetical protein
VTAKGDPKGSLPVRVAVGAPRAGEPGPGLDAGAYFGALRTRALGAVLLAAGELPSTQTLLQDNAALVPDGTVAVADRQVSGKGAQSRWTQRGCSRSACSPSSLVLACASHGTLAGMVKPLTQRWLPHTWHAQWRRPRQSCLALCRPRLSGAA